MAADDVRLLTQLTHDHLEITGVRLVWLIDPDNRIVTVLRDPNHSLTLTEDGEIDGGGRAARLSHHRARHPAARCAAVE